MGQQQIEGLACLAVVLTVLIAACSRKKWHGGTGTAHGTACWATSAMMQRAGMLSGHGLPLGRTPDGKLIRIVTGPHYSVFSPAGGGKTSGLAIPWLLTFPNSILALDVKGELYRLTSEKRRARGQKIVRLDPFGVCGPGGDSYNPLDAIGDTPDCVDEARAMAEAMVIRTGEEKDPYWNDQSANILTGFLSLILTELTPEQRNLSSLRDLLTDRKMFEAGAAHLRNLGHVYARLAGVIEQPEERERAGVISTANRHTTFIDSRAIISSLSSSSFNPEELLAGHMTIYLILPPHQLEAQARWLRLIIASLTGLIGRKGIAQGKECLFILDEAGQLGHMPAIEQGLTLLRSYGLRMSFFFQSSAQLKSVFREKESMLYDNTEQIYMGVNSLETAQRVSQMLGPKTIAIEDGGESEQRSRQEGGRDVSATVNHSTSRNYKELKRELLNAAEVLQLPNDVLIAFLRNVPPILCRRIKWYEDAAFGGRPRAKPSALLWWLLLAAAIGAVVWAVMGKT